jgi:PAS domain S-box-containing protein
MTSPTSPVPTPLEVSTRAFDALNEHDFHRLRSLMADDVVEHIVPLGVHDGPEDVLAYYKEVFAAAPDLRVELTHVAADGEAVLAAWELTATFTGAPFAGLQPNASRVRLEGASTHVVREGRVASAQVIFDGASVARQIGMLPARGSTADRAIIAAVNVKTRLQRRKAKRQLPREAADRLSPRQERTEKRRRQKRASVAPDELQDLLLQEELAVIATDLAGTVTDWSAGAERLYGWSRTEVIGRPITELTVGPEDTQVAENIMDCVRQTGRWEGEFWVRRKDGTAFLAHVREAMIADKHGTLIGLVGVSVEASTNGIDATIG